MIDPASLLPDADPPPEPKTPRRKSEKNDLTQAETKDIFLSRVFKAVGHLNRIEFTSRRAAITKIIGPLGIDARDIDAIYDSIKKGETPLDAADNLIEPNWLPELGATKNTQRALILCGIDTKARPWTRVFPNHHAVASLDNSQPWSIWRWRFSASVREWHFVMSPGGHSEVDCVRTFLRLIGECTVVATDLSQVENPRLPSAHEIENAKRIAELAGLLPARS